MECLERADRQLAQIRADWGPVWSQGLGGELIGEHLVAGLFPELFLSQCAVGLSLNKQCESILLWANHLQGGK